MRKNTVVRRQPYREALKWKEARCVQAHFEPSVAGPEKD